MKHGISIGDSARLRRRLSGAALAVGAVTLASCQIFSTEVKNPNAVTEDAIATASAAAGSLVTGLYGAVNAAGNQITGPALIEEHASTTVVQPGDSLRVDELGNLQITIGSDRS